MPPTKMNLDGIDTRFDPTKPVNYARYRSVVIAVDYADCATVEEKIIKFKQAEIQATAQHEQRMAHREYVNALYSGMKHEVIAHGRNGREDAKAAGQNHAQHAVKEFARQVTNQTQVMLQAIGAYAMHGSEIALPTIGNTPLPAIHDAIPVQELLQIQDRDDDNVIYDANAITPIEQALEFIRVHAPTPLVDGQLEWIHEQVDHVMPRVKDDVVHFWNFLIQEAGHEYVMDLPDPNGFLMAFDFGPDAFIRFYLRDEAHFLFIIGHLSAMLGFGDAMDLIHQ